MKKDIDDFSYRQGLNPSKRQFRIMTLSDNGFDEYIDKDSYTHFYLYEKHLDKYNKHMEERSKLKSSAIKHFGLRNDLKALKDDLDSKRGNNLKGGILEIVEEKQNIQHTLPAQQIEIHNQPNTQRVILNNNDHKKIIEFSNSVEENLYNINNLKYSQNIKSSQKSLQHHSLQNLHKFENYQHNNSLPFHTTQSLNFNDCKTSRNDTENIRYLASQTSPGFFRNTKSTQSSTKNNLKNFNLLSKSQTKPIRLVKGSEAENMAVTLQNLKESLSSFTNTSPRIFQKTESSMKGGFTCNKVPRVEHLRQEVRPAQSDAFKIYKNKFMISMKNDIEGENKRIKQILEDHHVPLPKIKKTKEPARKRYFSNTKFMGEKFDPSNYDYIFLYYKQFL
jgi:hypothetical protein